MVVIWWKGDGIDCNFKAGVKYEIGAVWKIKKIKNKKIKKNK